jgi:hypothetical protein
MKKISVLIGMFVVLTWGTSAWAAIALSFDGAQALPADTHVSDQYASYGVNFLNGDLASTFTNIDLGTISYRLYGPELGTPTLWTDGDGSPGSNTSYLSGFTPTSNFLGFNKTGTGIKFDSLVDSLSFDLYRSGTTAGQSTQVFIALYNTLLGGGPVATTMVQPYNNQPWKLFDSTSITSSQFDLAVVYATQRFMVDNLNAAPVPVPPAIFLFGSGLSGLFFLKRRKLTA